MCSVSCSTPTIFPSGRSRRTTPACDSPKVDPFTMTKTSAKSSAPEIANETARSLSEFRKDKSVSPKGTNTRGAQFRDPLITGDT